ncbi:hypothetical protein Dimus_015348 [Dionaea muscipula]
MKKKKKEKREELKLRQRGGKLKEEEEEEVESGLRQSRSFPSFLLCCGFSFSSPIRPPSPSPFSMSIRHYKSELGLVPPPLNTQTKPIPHPTQAIYSPSASPAPLIFFPSFLPSYRILQIRDMAWLALIKLCA